MSLALRASRRLRNAFLAGVVVLLPIVITVKGLWWLFATVDTLAEPLAQRLAGRPLPGLGFTLTLALVLVTGLLFSRGPLRRLLDALEQLVDRIPIAGTVYGTSRKVLEGLSRPDAESAFKRFVLARLPGRTTPGFVTGTFTLTRQDETRYALCTVYIPTNHLYVGDVVVLPVEDVIDTDLTVEDGVSLILSMGASVPPAVNER
jgi:uncharacterized membrane protein